MIDTRLPLALAGGLEMPRSGRLLVMHPASTARLKGLDPSRVDVVQDFKPDFDAWVSRGYQVLTEPQGPYVAALLCLSRAKQAARARVAEASAVTDGLLIIDGQKTDGVDSMLRDVRKRTALKGHVTKAHGKLFWCAAEESAFADWAQGPALTAGGFWTAPGVFSADAVDPASALLASVLPDQLGRHVVDLGAGWGFLSAHALTRPSVETIDLVEAGHLALACAEHNVTDPRARFHWADATTWTPEAPADTVIMNPPFHAERRAEPAIGQAFIAAACRVLGPRGELWMVANRHLPYEASLSAAFRNVAEIGEDSRFKLFHATGPRKSRP